MLVGVHGEGRARLLQRDRGGRAARCCLLAASSPLPSGLRVRRQLALVGWLREVDGGQRGELVDHARSRGAAAAAPPPAGPRCRRLQQPLLRGVVERSSRRPPGRTAPTGRRAAPARRPGSARAPRPAASGRCGRPAAHLGRPARPRRRPPPPAAPRPRAVRYGPAGVDRQQPEAGGAGGDQLVAAAPRARGSPAASAMQPDPVQGAAIGSSPRARPAARAVVPGAVRQPVRSATSRPFRMATTPNRRGASSGSASRSRDQRAVPLLEDVQRQHEAGEQRRVEREERKRGRSQWASVRPIPAAGWPLVTAAVPHRAAGRARPTAARRASARGAPSRTAGAAAGTRPPPTVVASTQPSRIMQRRPPTGTRPLGPPGAVLAEVDHRQQQVQGVERGVPVRRLARFERAAAGAREVERAHRPQHRHPHRGPARPVAVADGASPGASPTPARQRQRLAAAALLGQQHLAGVGVLTAGPQRGAPAARTARGGTPGWPPCSHGEPVAQREVRPRGSACS